MNDAPAAPPRKFQTSKVGSDLAWGKLVMSWTTQKDFVNGDEPHRTLFHQPARPWSTLARCPGWQRPTLPTR